MSKWEFSFRVDYTNAEMKSILHKMKHVKTKTGYFDFQLPGINLKKIQAKEFLGFKGGENVQSPFYAKIKHVNENGFDHIRIRTGITENVMWGIIGTSVCPVILLYLWIAPSDVPFGVVVAFSLFFLFGAVLFFFYFRYLLRTFQSDLKNFFLSLEKEHSLD